MSTSNEKDGANLRRLDFEIKETGKSVSEYLKSRGFSKGARTKLKKGEYVFFNGNPVPLKYYMTEMGILTLLIESGNSVNVEAEQIPISILFEDQDIIAVNKPTDMPTHPSHGHSTGTLANAVIGHCGKMTFRAINRLDRNTSGIVLIAKNTFSAGKIKSTVKKEYIAIVHGQIKNSGEITAPIKRADKYQMKRIVSDDGEYARTIYEPVLTNGEYTVLRLRLMTGRTHQIRVHMAHIGHPLVGDELYGGSFELGFTHQALHCEKMSFIHPVTDEIISLAAPLPEKMQDAIKKLSD